MAGTSGPRPENDRWDSCWIVGIRLREETEIRKRTEYLEHQLNDRQAKDIVLGSLRALRWVVNDTPLKNWK
jgi:hypothetical protein